MRTRGIKKGADPTASSLLESYIIYIACVAVTAEKNDDKNELVRRHTPSSVIVFKFAPQPRPLQ